VGSIWAVAALYLLVTELRRSTTEGRRRMLALEQDQLRDVVERYRGRALTWVLATWSVSNAVNAVIVASEGRWGEAGISLGAVVVLVVTLVVHRRNREVVLRETAHLDLARPAVAPRDTSATRSRRVRQLGVVAVTAVLLAPVALTVAEALSGTWSTVLLVLGVTLLAVAVLALTGLAWASAWVYGDEEPAAER